MDVERAVVAAIETANRILIRRAEQAGPKPLPHAATIVVAVVRGADAWIASAGDCRAYLIRSGAIRQLTQDHTVAAEEVRRGRLRAEDIARHPGRNTITRCLGQRAVVRPDLFHEQIHDGDRIVLCSDGITRHVSDEQIIQIVTSAEPKTAASRLVELANQRGGSDNITIGIMELVEVRKTDRALTPRPSLSDVSASRLAALQTMSQRINASLEVSATLTAVLDSLIEITGAERACVMLRDPATGPAPVQRWAQPRCTRR